MVGLLIIAALTAFKVKGAILIGIVATTLLGIPFGVTTLPTQLFKLPDFSQVGNLCFQFDFTGLFTPCLLYTSRGGQPPLTTIQYRSTD